MHHQCHHQRAEIAYFIGLSIYLLHYIIPLPFEDLWLLSSALLAGYHVSEEGVLHSIHQSKKAKKFIPNAHLLMLLAAIGATLSGNVKEAAVLMLIFAGAHFLEAYAENKSKKEMTALLKMQPSTARIIKNETIAEIHVDAIEVNDKIQILNGEQVPLDGVIIEGMTTIDEATINGESVPVAKTINDCVYAGTMNISETIVVRVTKKSDETLFAKILKLVDEVQSQKTKVQTFIQKFEVRYVKFVIYSLPIIFLFLNQVLRYSIDVSIYRTLIYLVIASPCALAVSATPAMLATMSAFSKQKILFKKASDIVSFKDIKVFAFDKTGTLTTGKMHVAYCSFQDQETLSMIKAAEMQSNHPIAFAIVSYLNQIDATKQLLIENKVGEGMHIHYQNDTYFIGKTTQINDFKQWRDEIESYQKQGATVIIVTKNHVMIGYFALMDTIQLNAHAMIQFLKTKNIQTVMISGDHEITANNVAKQLGIDTVYANVLPERKNEIINHLKNTYGCTAMMGDGVNDSIALSNADLSIAMGEGSDVAIESADIILMNNDLSKIKTIFNASKKLNTIIKINILFAFLVIGLLLIFNFLGMTNILVSVLSHELSTLIIILFSLQQLWVK